MNEFVKTPPDMVKYIGETGKATNGQRVVIIAARSLEDMDVMFEDGLAVWSTTYAAVKSGTLERPKWPSPGPGTNVRVGRMGRSKEGLPISILAYRTSIDMDVIFEDGTVLIRKRYTDFRDGKIRYPKK